MCYPSSTPTASSLPTSQSHSVCGCQHLLIALGIISLIGSLVATGCLYSRLEEWSFAIGGAGVCVSILCFSLSTLTKEAPNGGAIKRVACRHEGNSCFVNTPLQAMVQVPAIRDLFDSTKNKLEKSSEETDTLFIKRKKVQEAGHALITCILDGNQAQNLESFTSVLNDFLKEGDFSHTHNLKEGGCKHDLIMDIIVNVFAANDITIFESNPNNIDIDSLKNWIIEKGNIVITTLVCLNSIPPLSSEIVLEGIGTYQLEAIMVGKGFHCKPIIRQPNGDFLMLDDMCEPEVIPKDALSAILKREGTNLMTEESRPVAFYVKI